MKEIIIKSSNLNNSLVFYRALLNRMPDEITPSCIRFKIEQFILIIRESTTPDHKINHLIVSEQKSLDQINQRMSRFNGLERLQEDCEIVDKAIGITDPDGNKWVVGDPEVTVNFKKCYLELETY